jgi:Na+/alanine symporter
MTCAVEFIIICSQSRWLVLINKPYNMLLPALSLFFLFFTTLQVVATVVKILGALSTISESRFKPVGIVCCIADPDTTNILKEVD